MLLRPRNGYSVPSYMSQDCWRRVRWTTETDSEGSEQMLIRPAETAELATPAVLKVTGKCGEKHQLSIAGVSVEFICEPQTPPSPETPPPQETTPRQEAIPTPEVIPSPHPQEPGRVALVINDLATLLGQLPGKSEIDLDADPVIFTVPYGRSVSLNDLSHHILASIFLDLGLMA